jgi:protein HIRA/HIR1
VSKFGAQRIGNWRLRFENLSRILLGVPFSDDSGESGNFLGTGLIIGSSWSPDGAHITASNATNNKGFVFIAAVIARNSWTSEISLVGHENTVEVAVSVCTMAVTAVKMNVKIFKAYNPHIFLRNPAAPVATSNICSVVALGADDRSVSIWQTKSARPIIVAKEVFERQIMDLSW